MPGAMSSRTSASFLSPASLGSAHPLSTREIVHTQPFPPATSGLGQEAASTMEDLLLPSRAPHRASLTVDTSVVPVGTHTVCVGEGGKGEFIEI